MDRRRSPRAPALAPTALHAKAQRQRRARIVDIAVAIAEDGGYDAVYMHAVAAQSNVALATVYRYFPSKTHLLVAALECKLNYFAMHVTENTAGIDDPNLRLQVAVRHLIAGMEQFPRLADALLRGYVRASVTLTDDVGHVTRQLSDIFATAVSNGVPGRHQRQIGDLMSDIWSANMLALSHGTRSIPQVRFGLCRTVSLLCASGPHERS